MGVAVSGASALGDSLGTDTETDGRVRVGDGRSIPSPPQPLSSSTASPDTGRIHARDRVAPGVRVSMSEAFLPHVGGDCPEVCAGDAGVGITRTG